MSRNGSGVYSIPNTFAPGTTISSSGENQNFSDIGSEITNSLAADGQTSMTGQLKGLAGTAAAPGYTFSADLDTGAYRSAANKYSVAAGGSQITETSSSGLDIKTGTLLIAGVTAMPVPTAQIADDAVTYAKIQNVSATSRLLGRATSGAGDVEEVTLGQGLAMSAGALVASTVVPTVQTLTSGTSATYTTPAGVKWLEIIVQGGGGGGGGGNQLTLSTAGGSTTFGSFTAGGGAGSSYTVAGAGGTATGGHINRVGAPGSPGSTPGLSHNGQGGTGGGTIFGGGGAGISGNSTGASAAANTGGGGGGGGNTNGTLDGSGGNGGAAGGTIHAFINSPSATYTYTIGAGGGGGSAGSINSSAGGAGGSGGSGVVVVIEHY